MYIADELFKLADFLEGAAAQLNEREFDGPLQALIDEAEKAGRAWSGSWLGYHSRIYYLDLRSPPPGARFSQEWGMMDVFSPDTVGEWREYRFEDIVEAIRRAAGNPDLDEHEKKITGCRSQL